MSKNSVYTLNIVNSAIQSSPVLMRELGGDLDESTIARLASLPYEALNEFVGAIMKVVKSYAYTTIFERADNPFAPFFREKLEAGFTVEDMYIKLFDGHDFDYTGAAALQRHKPDVVDMFYSVNFEKEYDISVSLEQAKTAFLTLSGVEQFMAQQYNSLYSSAERDIWRECLNIFGEVYTNGDYTETGVSALSSEANIKAFLETLKNTISGFQFLGTSYNPLATEVKTRPEDVLVVMPANVVNKVDVQTLAGAFNLDKIEIRNQIITVPATSGFGAKMASEGTLAIVVDKNFFRIYPQTFDALSQLNASGFFTNTHLLSRWIFSYGRFYNVARIYDSSATYALTTDLKNYTGALATSWSKTAPAGSSPFTEGTTVTYSCFAVEADTNPADTVATLVDANGDVIKELEVAVGIPATGKKSVSITFTMPATPCKLVATYPEA